MTRVLTIAFAFFIVALPASADEEALRRIVAVQQAELAALKSAFAALRAKVDGAVSDRGDLLVAGEVVVNANKEWKGAPSGLRGEKGEKGDRGETGPKGDNAVVGSVLNVSRIIIGGFALADVSAGDGTSCQSACVGMSGGCVAAMWTSADKLVSCDNQSYFKNCLCAID